MNAISDLHLRPGDTSLDLRQDGPLVLVGDTFNIIPDGLRAWRSIEGARTIRSLLDQLPNPQDVWFISGNHDPLRWLKMLVGDKHRCSRYLDLEGWRFIHGHQFSEWRWLSRWAPGLTEMLTSNPITCRAWYWFCQRQGWMASGVSGSNEKYEKLVSVIWGWAVKEAHDRKMNLCFGHTHQAMTFEDDFVKVIDCGARELATPS